MLRIGAAPCLLALAAISIMLGGCNKGTPPEVVKPRTDMKTLVILYQRYLASHRGQPPKNVDEFKKFVRENHKELANFLGEFDPDKAFISPRDQQPLEWNFPKPSGGPGLDPVADSVLVYEKTGVDGKRLAAYSGTSSVVELTDDELKAALSGAKGS